MIIQYTHVPAFRAWLAAMTGKIKAINNDLTSIAETNIKQRKY